MNATVLGRALEPKRPEHDHTFSESFPRQINSSCSTNGTSARYTTPRTSDTGVQINNRPRKSAPAHRKSEPEILEISDGEDIGKPLPRPQITSSPDPLDTIHPFDNVHPFETHPGQHQPRNSWKGKGKGPAQAPKAGTAFPSDVEEIEDFTSEAGKDWSLPPRQVRSQPAAICTPSIPSGIVNKKRGMFEPKIPFLNLRKKNALDGGTGVAKKMKPKRATKVRLYCPFFCNDSCVPSACLLNVSIAARPRRHGVYTIHI